MKNVFILLLTVFFFYSCNQDNQTDTQGTSTDETLVDLTINKDYLEHKNLRIYFVNAPTDFIEQNAVAAELEVLKTALNQPKFRISEHKPFGRRDDSGAVNQLTVENKLPTAVFLMSGDVVQGGKQDRAIGEDQIIAANSIKNIPVFCVEQGRWTYHNDQPAENPRGDRIAAFSGYYNVASNGVRKSIKSGNQQAVWDMVAEVTSSNEAESDSKAYAALETSDKFKNSREAYLEAFNEDLITENTIGIIIASGNEIIGTDVFGHPALLKKTYEALLHGYITDAITQGQPIAVEIDEISKYTKKISRKIADKNALKYQGAFIHYADL
jgi:hypothetical protein